MVHQLSSFTGRPQFPAGLRVLLCDSCPASRDAAQAQLKAQNYEVTCCTSIREAVAAISRAEPFDVLLTSASAFQATKGSEKLREQLKDLPTVVMIENPKPEEVMQSIKWGACEVLEKPLCPLRLKTLWQHQARRMIRTASAPTLRRRSSGALADNSSSQNGASSPSHTQSAQRGSLEFNSASSGTLDAALKQQPADASATMPDTPRRAVKDVEDARRGQKRKSKELHRCFTSPVPLADATPRSTTTPLDVPTVTAPTPLPALGTTPMTAPSTFPATCSAPNTLNGWPAPHSAPVTASGGLLPGMAWGVPMNPMAVAPGITPPIFPAPTGPVAPFPSPQWPSVMPQAGMPAMMPPMPPMPPMPTPGMFGAGLMPGMPMMPPANPFAAPMAMPGQLPPLPMSMLAGAVTGMPGGMPGMCGGMAEGACVPPHVSPCSPAVTDPSAVAYSDKSAQDFFTYGAEQGANMASRAKMARCESNNLLPLFEDLIGENAADDMELELEALSLGCLGSAPTIPTGNAMKRIDSLEDSSASL